MGTNFYIERKKPTIRQSIHICKMSYGWKTTWQATGECEWPRWCDEDCVRDDEGKHASDHTLPHSINSVDDIRALLESGEWMLVDEYGTIYSDEPLVDAMGCEVADWRTKLVELESRMPDGRDHASEWGGFHDSNGNVFCRGGFC